MASELLGGVSVFFQSFSAFPMLHLSFLVVFSCGACMSTCVGVVGSVTSLAEHADAASSEDVAFWLVSLIEAVAVHAIASAAATVASPATCGEVELLQMVNTEHYLASSAAATPAAIGACGLVLA